MRYIIFSLMLIGVLIYILGTNQQKIYDIENKKEITVLRKIKLDTRGKAKEEIKKNYSLGGVIGFIEIPKIGVKLPVKEGTTENILKTSAGHIIGTSKIGESGNCFISAHRSWTYGDGEGCSYAIEKIFVKQKNQEEIRFSYYKEQSSDIHGSIISKLVPRPLDLSEKELLELFQKAINEGIFSKEFLKTLKSILSDSK